MDAVLQDLRYAWRSLRREPAFTMLAVGTLAPGIGANAAIFSAVNAVLLRPLDYYRPDRIVALTTQWQTTGRRGAVSAPDYHDWHDATTSFAAMGYYTYPAGGETSVIVDAARRMRFQISEFRLQIDFGFRIDPGTLKSEPWKSEIRNLNSEIRRPRAIVGPYMEA
jgi:hypothetical protein